MNAIPLIRKDSTRASFAQAIDAWRQAIGDGQVLTDTASYNVDTSSFSNQIPVVLRPDSSVQVQQIAKIAQRFSVPVYPQSTGNNWGYGTSVPVRSPGAVVDLRSMNKVKGFDQELGVVTLEPGVTQGDLSRFLDARNLPFMVPVTGAGPSCSVLANALERGFGVTPLTDHFGAIMSMKVVLPDGEIFESYSRRFDRSGVAQAFKWGTGPYLEGLFSQSNFGIVVDASIALQARAERSGALFFVLDVNEQVEAATESIREILTSAGNNIGAINVMSRNRVECMLNGSRRVLQGNGTGSGTKSASGSGTKPSGSGDSMPPGGWFGFGSVYGSKEHYRATCRLVRQRLKGKARQIRIYTAGDIRRLRWLSDRVAVWGWSRLPSLVDRLEAAIGIVEGRPSTFALPLAYAKSGRVGHKETMNPARDGCGLFWYAPIVPLKQGTVGQFIEFVEGICLKHGMPSPITLTTLSPRCYASTVPLLFDRTNPDAERRATLCFEELHQEGLALGFVPYRIGAQFMPALMRHGADFWAVVDVIKKAVDPNMVLAPGRYSLSGRRAEEA